MKNSNASRLGFTLIELLVVVLIIGILAAVALPKYQVAVLKSRYLQMQTLAKSLIDAQNVYYMANGEYTGNFENLDVNYPANFISGQYETIPTISYGKYSGYFYLASGKQIVAVDMYYDGRLEHVFYGDGSRYCRAKQNDTVAQSVCKSFGGGPSGHVYAGYVEYNMP